MFDTTQFKFSKFDDCYYIGLEAVFECKIKYIYIFSYCCDINAS